MKIRFPISVALAVSIAAHAVLLRAALKSPEVGRNTPVLKYPVRVRLLQTQLAPNAVTPKTLPPRPEQKAPAVIPPATIMEGRIDRNEEIYLEFPAAYFSAGELDEKPVITTSLDLGVESIGATVTGEATLRIFLNERGDVDRLDVEDSSLPPAMMEQLQLQLQRNELHFTPGSKNHINVKSVIRYKIVLERDPGIKSIFTPGTKLK
jgi:hypothetical protein